MNLDALIEIMDAIKRNEIQEVLITHDRVEIRTYAKEAFTTATAPAVPVAPVAAPAAPAAPAAAPAALEETKAPAAEAPKAAPEKEEEAPAPAAAPAGTGKLEVVEVPIPGTAFVSPGKDLDGKPLPNVGDKVKEGDIIALIEAMKMFNEVVAPVSGIIKEIKVSNEQSVNVGDVLMVIEEA